MYITVLYLIKLFGIPKQYTQAIMIRMNVMYIDTYYKYIQRWIENTQKKLKYVIIFVE